MFAWQPSAGQEAASPAEPSPPFHRLLDQARRGEAEALSRLYRQFLPGVFGYVAARVPDRATAEDLTSEVFLKMVESIHRLRATEEASFAAWILQIARITVAGYYRQHQRQPTMISLTGPAGDEAGEEHGALLLPPSPPDADPAHQAEAREQWREVVAAINALTEEQRQVLVSRLILGYDIETVGRMLGKKGNAIKALQFRALQRLQRLLQMKPRARQALPSRTQRQGGPS